VALACHAIATKSATNVTIRFVFRMMESLRRLDLRPSAHGRNDYSAAPPLSGRREIASHPQTLSMESLALSARLTSGARISIRRSISERSLPFLPPLSSDRERGVFSIRKGESRSGICAPIESSSSSSRCRFWSPGPPPWLRDPDGQPERPGRQRGTGPAGYRSPRKSPPSRGPAPRSRARTVTTSSTTFPPVTTRSPSPSPDSSRSPGASS